MYISDVYKVKQDSWFNKDSVMQIEEIDIHDECVTFYLVITDDTIYDKGKSHVYMKSEQLLYIVKDNIIVSDYYVCRDYDNDNSIRKFKMDMVSIAVKNEHMRDIGMFSDETLDRIKKTCRDIYVENIIK